jgi:hypothetical protein
MTEDRILSGLERSFDELDRRANKMERMIIGLYVLVALTTIGAAYIL